MGGDLPRPLVAQERADRAQAREIDTHRRAIALHEAAARIFKRQEHAERAAGAMRRAQHAREMLALALEEQKQSVTTTGRLQANASSGLPPEGTTGG